MYRFRVFKLGNLGEEIVATPTSECSKDNGRGKGLFVMAQKVREVTYYFLTTTDGDLLKAVKVDGSSAYSVLAPTDQTLAIFKERKVFWEAAGVTPPSH